jgi:hypothetical protein
MKRNDLYDLSRKLNEELSKIAEDKRYVDVDFVGRFRGSNFGSFYWGGLNSNVFQLLLTVTDNGKYMFTVKFVDSVEDYKNKASDLDILKHSSMVCFDEFEFTTYESLVDHIQIMVRTLFKLYGVEKKEEN